MSNVETRPLILIPEDQPNQALKMLYPKLRERRVAIGKIKRSDHKNQDFCLKKGNLGEENNKEKK